MAHRAGWGPGLAVVLVAASALGACDSNEGSPSSRSDRRPALTAGPAIPEARSEVGGALWAGKIAVAGGFPGTNQSSDRLDLFDLSSGTWSLGPTLPHHYDHSSLAELDGRLYLVGGYTGSFANPTNEVWSLGPDEATWTAELALATGRGALATASAGGKLIAIGGVDENRTVLTSTEIFTPGDGWTAGPDLSIPREHVGIAATGEKVYAIAGRNADGATNSVESLVVGDDEWQPEPDLHDVRSGAGAATTASGLVCIGGGEILGQPDTIPSIECLDGGRWQRVATMSVPRHGLAVVAKGDRVHFVAGARTPASFEAVDAHEVLAVDP